MFEAFGFSERVLNEAYFVNETSFWQPDEATPEHITRGGKVQDTEDGLSEFPHVILNQARVHDFYLDVMRNAPTRLVPHYGHRVLDLTVAAPEAGGAAASHPVTVRLERPDGAGHLAMETVRARYVVGCDGARSAVRAALGHPLHGDSANQAWGVMDVLAVTDFPDIRLKAAIHSAGDGSMLVIPREGGYLVRLYIELDRLEAGERIAARAITVEGLIATAQRIIRPYALEVKEVAWWSVYEIGQRLCPRFDDRAEEGGAPRVFIAGDACHTHSPKAGQGMNVSMQDAFNLGWKLAAVLRGQSAPGLLATYSAERRAIAQELIDFDRAFARMFSAAPKRRGAAGGDGIDPAEFQSYFVRQARFTAGTATCYVPSAITATPRHQHLAPGFPIGMRFHSAPVIRLADARPMQLGHTVKADGRWRLFLFADDKDPADPACCVRALCAFLADAADSPLRRHTPAGADSDAVIDVRAVYQRGHRDIPLSALPPLLLPRKGRHGLIDYEKAFCADAAAGDIFAMRAIDRAAGCVVIVRPDQYVADVLPLGARGEVAGFFARVMG
ncbi:phenol 2-monooxygenase [Chelatococcus reniformis]|uniref:Phenol 2-monooxygenase n=1 Tax=Chelatococcus reniformis TaxID=1494448 RepID=A0A916UPS0_9HYPH|nr:phenol 2-monooxygenase [Chelatococcus reniformis]